MQNGERGSLLAFRPGAKVKSYELVDRILDAAPGSEFIDPLGEGGSSVVYRARQVLHEDVSVDRAVKFFVYSDEIAALTKNRYGGLISKEDFLSEILNISQLNHESVVKVIDAGIHGVSGPGPMEIPYLVTDFILGPTLREIIEAPDDTGNSPASAAKATLRAEPLRIIDLLLRIAHGLEYIHSRRFAHCDIAPKNIFVDTRHDLRPIIGDLGISKDLGRSRETAFVAGSKNYMPPQAREFLNQEIPWGEFRELHPHWDVFGFAKTGLELIDAIGIPTSHSWVAPLRLALEQARDGSRYREMSALIGRLDFLSPVQREIASVPELSTSISGGERKLLPITTLYASDRISELIRHPALLRLARVPQLVTVFQRFPGANHTRFEHSLGVLETVRRYILALLNESEFLTHLDVPKIELALVAGALSNVTRFPFSMLLQDLEGKDGRLSDFSSENLLDEIFAMRDASGDTLADLLERYFPQVDQGRLRRFLLKDKRSFDPEDHLIWSFLNCSLDAKVVDFVRRDALHVGLVHGSFDLDELLPHFTIYQHRLALKTTGVSAAEEVISLRYWLYNRLYWNRPNRAYAAMVRYLLIELTQDASFVGTLRSKALELNELEFLHLLRTEAKRLNLTALSVVTEPLCELNQDIYRTVFDVSRKESADLQSTCERIAQKSYEELVDLSRKLQSHVKADLGLNLPADQALLLIDMPNEPGPKKLGEDIIVIRPDGAIANLTDYSGIVGGINSNFESHLQRLRVFMHPRKLPPKEQRRRLWDSIAGFFRDF